MTDQPTDFPDKTKNDFGTGRSVGSVVPTSINETWRVAQVLSASEDMVPEHFQGKPNKVMGALMMGMDIGLKPMQALRAIAMINGRPCLWGDALPALALKHGHELDVELEGEGDDMVAIATLVRGDTGKTFRRTFSVEDAKRAGLWQSSARVTRKSKSGGTYEKDNDSPWWKYPKRMLSHRARGWAMRDGAADVLMGLAIVEEERDSPRRMRDVTPDEEKTGGFAKMVNEARGVEIEEVSEATDTDEIKDIEDSTDDLTRDDEIAEDEDSTDDLLTRDDFEAGRRAAEKGEERKVPDGMDMEEMGRWLAGYDSNFAEEEES